MKKQLNPAIKAHLIRSAFYLLLLLGVCAIPFALAQSRSRGTARQSMAKPSIVLNSSFKPAESTSGLAIAANPDFQGASPKKDDVTKTSEVPVMANPDPRRSYLSVRRIVRFRRRSIEGSIFPATAGGHLWRQQH